RARPGGAPGRGVPGLARGLPFRAAPGRRRISGLDRGAEEHALDAVLSAGGAGLSAVGAGGAPAERRLPPGDSLLWARDPEQVGGRDPAGRPAPRALVAARVAARAPGRAPAAALVCARRRRRAFHRLGRADLRGGAGRRLRAERRPAAAGRGPGLLVLPGEAPLAGEADL